MAEKPPAKDSKPTDPPPAAPPAEPRWAVEITMSHAEQERLRTQLQRKFH